MHKSMPMFVQLTHLVARDGIWCIVGQLYSTDSYLRHYHAYSVSQTSEWVAIVPGFVKDFHAYRPYRICVDGKDLQLISVQHKLKCVWE